MNRILKYTVFDLMRSRWIYFYIGFYLAVTVGLSFISNDHTQLVLSLMNITLVLTPLVATLFGAIYFYNSHEFTELLLAQPIPRSNIFLGQYLGLTLSLSLSLVVGIAIPSFAIGLIGHDNSANLLNVLGVSVLLTCIFCAISAWVALRNPNRIRGFGLAIFLWLFFAVIYDAAFLILLATFSDYPLETPAIALSLLNPIDLGRILITLQMDLAALMGYTGAVFNKVLGSSAGTLICWGVLVVWAAMPVLGVWQTGQKKDF